jgi:hypothetical protein
MADTPLTTNEQNLKNVILCIDETETKLNAQFAAFPEKLSSAIGSPDAIAAIFDKFNQDFLARSDEMRSSLIDLKELCAHDFA